MKKSFHLSHVILLLCLVLVLISCRDNTAVITDEITPINEIKKSTENELPTATIEELFTHLSQIENVQNLSMQDQYVILQNYATEKGINFDLSLATKAYEAALENEDGQITKEEEFFMKEIETMKDLIQLYGFTPELVEALEIYKSNLISYKKMDHDLDPTSYDAVIGMVNHTSEMVTNNGFKRYIAVTSPVLLNASFDERFNWGCFWASLALAGAIAGCASGFLGSCLAIFTAEIAVLENCSDNTYVDPCLNSPNPCCGVVCIQGYTCNSSGNCVVDIYYDCTVTGCPPNEQCLNNLCVPL